MRKLASASLLAGALLLIFAAPSLAWSRGGHFHGHFHGGPRVFIGVGPAFWWGGYPYPYYYYPPPYYYPPAQIVVEQPTVYVQPETAPPAWYYCPSAQGYYPYVQSCPEAWVKVPPRAP